MNERPDPRTLTETGIAILFASMRLRIDKFDDIVTRLTYLPGAPKSSREEAAMIGRALDAWGRHVPWRTLCFEKGLAACSVLKRRGKCFTLFYGARGNGDSLEAHVWVKSGNEPVTGCENASEFRELARYPVNPEP